MVREKARVANGLKELDIVVVQLVGAYDSRRISSSRIRRGEIGREGERIS